MQFLRAAIFTFAAILATSALAQTGGPLSNEQLVQLTQNGINLTLGGPGHGYEGTLKLKKNGKGNGKALTDSANEINISGTWAIKGDQFCRVWKEHNDGNEICETWVLTSGRRYGT